MPDELVNGFPVVSPVIDDLLRPQRDKYGIHPAQYGGRNLFPARVTAAIKPFTTADRRSGVAYLLERASEGRSVFGPDTYGEPNGVAILRALTRRTLAWKADDFAWLMRYYCSDHQRLREGEIVLASAMVAHIEMTPEHAVTGRELDILQRRLADRGAEQEWHSWPDPRQRFEALSLRLELVVTPEGQTAKLPENVLDDRDTFGPVARAAVLARADEATVVRVLLHLKEYPDGPRPTVRWRRTAAELMTDPSAVAVARALVQTLAVQSDGERTIEYWDDRPFVDPASERVVKGAVWALGDADHSVETTRLLGKVGAHCAITMAGRGGTTRAIGVTNATIAVLATRADQSPVADVVAALAHVRLRAGNRAVMLTVDRAIAQIAADQERSSDELLEQAVPTFELDADGTTTRVLGDHVATLSLADDTPLRLEVTWRHLNGRLLKSVPTAVRRDHSSAAQEIREMVREVRKQGTIQHDRLDRLLASHRGWDVTTWTTHYLEHPLVSRLSRQLLWVQSAPSGAIEAGLPTTSPNGDWGLRDLEDVFHPLVAGATVQLWHPISQPLQDITRWRTRLQDLELVQPLRQVFREIYLLTPAEETTAAYSNRYSAHVLRYPQAAALMRRRGWRAAQLGDWDNVDGEATRVFEESGLRVSFFLDRMDDGFEDVQLCATDQVRFSRRGTDGEWQSVPLVEVDALIFSEAMRDVDLFVGVTSIANDPNWIDQGEDRFDDYWHATSFGDLTASAEVRREALERLLPRTRLAGRARLEGRFLVVTGSLHEYKIHLGSTNILMSPADTYLCIVGDRGHQSGSVMLPFEQDDGKLAMILSKAFLLMDDLAIQDPTILAQIR